MENIIDEMKQLPDEALESVSGGVDLSGYSVDDLAGIITYYWETFGNTEKMRGMLETTFGITHSDIDSAIRQSRSETGSNSSWPYYCAESVLARD